VGGCNATWCRIQVQEIEFGDDLRGVLGQEPQEFRVTCCHHHGVNCQCIGRVPESRPSVFLSTLIGANVEESLFNMEAAAIAPANETTYLSQSVVGMKSGALRRSFLSAFGPPFLHHFG
jgi:hypothetical protein